MCILLYTQLSLYTMFINLFHDQQQNMRFVRMNEREFYVPFNALLGYIGTATSKGMKSRMIVLSDVH